VGCQGHRRVRSLVHRTDKEDLASATQVAQAVAALREEGPALGDNIPIAERLYRDYTTENQE
jgi:hypothetical protein